MKPGHRKLRTGCVIGNKMNKTVTVTIERTAQHGRFQKYLRMSKNVKAHDEKNECQVGDWVQIVETRPISKEKHWRVQKILRKVLAAGVIDDSNTDSL